MKNKIALLSLLLVLSFAYRTFAQTDSLTIKNLTRSEIVNLDYNQLLALPFEDLLLLANKMGVSIDELLEMSLTVSSKTSLKPRETPGIVSIITADEIKTSGARDLMDIFQTLPGFNFGYDVDGVIGLSSRGNWGHEGKILVLVDGMEMNEGLYTTYQFGNHFPVDQIERIEIIRGPGSSLYGGYAELGVINIITKSAYTLDGTEIYGTLGTFSDIFSRTSAGINFGKVFNDLAIDLKGFYGSGIRSNKRFVDFYGDLYKSTDGYFDYQTVNINMGIKYKDLETRFIFDDFIPNATGYDKPERDRFHGLFGQIKYTFDAGSKLKIQPSVSYKNQLPYWFNNEDWPYKKSYDQYTGALDAVYQPTEKLDVIGGLIYKYEIAKNKLDDPDETFYNGEKEISFNTISAYLQGTYKSKIANIFLGARFDNHSEAGNNISPRIGITKAYNKFHYKLLYSNAFRTPSIENINLNQDIKSEKTNVAELELGYKLTDNMFLTTNLFYILINNPIVYTLDVENDLENYENYDKTGTQGIEVEYLVKYSKWFLDFSYSFYSAKDLNEVIPYSVEIDGATDESLLKGSPQHKFSIKGAYNFTDHISFSPSFVYLSERYGYIIDDQGQSKTDPTLLLNAFFLYKDLGFKNFDLGIGIYNILDQDYRLVQPYGEFEATEAPYPTGGIEFTLKLGYRF
jgi:outer membrane receptor for ferrienterochelin and colicin